MSVKRRPNEATYLDDIILSVRNYYLDYYAGTHWPLNALGDKRYYPPLIFMKDSSLFGRWDGCEKDLSKVYDTAYK